MKTKVAASTLSNSGQLSSVNIVFFHIDDEACRKYIPSEHLVHELQQATVLSTNVFIYIVTSETRILYSVLVRTTAVHREVAFLALASIADPVLMWAYNSKSFLLLLIPSNDIDVVKNKLTLRKLVNERVLDEDLFLQLKLFKHATQCFYSKKNEEWMGRLSNVPFYEPQCHISDGSKKWCPKL